MDNILYTGFSGFLGNNIMSLLEQKYKVFTLGLGEGDYQCDLTKTTPDFKEKYKTVLHASGKAHSVPRTEKEKQVFFDVNLEGTKNVCKALEKIGVPENFVFISTVAVYGLEDGENISEDHPLNGDTPYALSKRMAEEFLLEWSDQHGVNLTILRPSLIAGVKPVGNLGAMVAGIKTGKYFRIGKGEGHKSVLMASDIVNLLPLLENKKGIYNICDSHHPTFAELEDLICKQLGKSGVVRIPYWLAKSMALVGDCLGSKAPINSSKLDKIVKSLTFSNEKAKRELNWEPLNVLDNFRIK